MHMMISLCVICQLLTFFVLCWCFTDTMCFCMCVNIKGDADQERIKRQQELNALSIYQLQQLQYQYILRYDLVSWFPLHSTCHMLYKATSTSTSAFF